MLIDLTDSELDLIAFLIDLQISHGSDNFSATEFLSEDQLDDLAVIGVKLSERNEIDAARKRFQKLLSIIFICLSLAAPAHCAEEGLVKVEKLPKAHWWNKTQKQFHYQTKTGEVEIASKKRKKVKDLRSYEVRHPRRAWTQEFFTRWQSTTSAGVGVAITGLQAWQAARGNGNVVKVRLVK